MFAATLLCLVVDTSDSNALTVSLRSLGLLLEIGGTHATPKYRSNFYLNAYASHRTIPLTEQATYKRATPNSSSPNVQLEHECAQAH